MDKWKSKQDECLLEGTRPAGQVPSLEIFGPGKVTHPTLISTHPFSPSVQTESLKTEFVPSYFVRLLELMPVFLSSISYDFR